MDGKTRDWSAVTARLDAVEGWNRKLCRQVRGLRAVSVLGVLVIGALLLTAAAVDKQTEVKAERFVLVDAHGRGRALLTTSANHGAPALMLYDTKDKIRIVLAVEGDEPCLQFLNGNGKLDAQLSVVDDRRTLSLMDENGTLRAALQVSKDGATLSLHDENGETTHMAPAKPAPVETIDGKHGGLSGPP